MVQFQGRVKFPFYQQTKINIENITYLPLDVNKQTLLHVNDCFTTYIYQKKDDLTQTLNYLINHSLNQKVNFDDWSLTLKIKNLVIILNTIIFYYSEFNKIHKENFKLANEFLKSHEKELSPLLLNPKDDANTKLKELCEEHYCSTIAPLLIIYYIYLKLEALLPKFSNNTEITSHERFNILQYCMQKCF